MFSHTGDFSMRKHFLKHRCVTIFWQSFEFLREIAIITVRADRNASANSWIELTRIALPLLARIIFEEHFVQLPSYLRKNQLFRIFWIIDFNTPVRQLRLHLLSS